VGLLVVPVRRPKSFSNRICCWVSGIEHGLGVARQEEPVVVDVGVEQQADADPARGGTRSREVLHHELDTNEVPRELDLLG